jgi:hypothetical protein
MRIILLVSLVAGLLLSCSPKPKVTTEPEGFGTAKAADLTIKPAQTDVTLEWDTATKTTIDISWAAGQKYPVQVSLQAGSPDWLKVETHPAILEPPGTMELEFTADVYPSALGTHKVTFEASAYGMSRPVEFTLNIEVTRQTGEFNTVQGSEANIECRNVCGQIKNGMLTFYDLLKEKDQECGDKALPETQRIGVKSWSLSDKGYGFGRGCRVAGIYEANGGFSLVNLGFYDLALKRGDVLATIRDVDRCWLSSDNTLAIIQSGRGVYPFDVIKGRQIGDVCYPVREIGRAVLQGTKLSAGECEWTLP